MASRRIRRTKSLAGYTAAVYQDLIDLKTRSNYRSIAASAITGGGLAEEIELINKSLQSSNYMPGVDGWKIDGSGNAEFGNVYVRGDINAYSGTIGYWNISNPSVERTFGDTTLFGTFLESFDHGFTDDGATIGTYVSLFKSYIDIPIAITKVSVISDIVTITAPDHSFIVGDKVIIEFDNAAYSAYETETYLVVTEVTPDTFSYVTRGTPAGTAGVQQAEVEASGMAQIYNEDIAGLYLRDYAKTGFDYGFFSNKGIAYTSAEVLNLVHNPSFEYLGLSNTSGWSASSGLTSITFPNTDFRYSSNHGVNITWTSPARSDYLIGNIDYDAGNDYNIFDTAIPLYLGFDIFPAAPDASPSAVSSAATSGTSNVLITTSTTHGLAIGDDVYLNFSAIDANELEYAYDGTYADYGPKVFDVVGIPTLSSFLVKNVQALNSGSLTLSASPTVYRKVISPALNLSEIKFKFGTDETTVLANVLTDVYTSDVWSDTGNRELSISATEIVENSRDTVIPPMKNADGVSYVELDSKKIKDLYSTLDPSGFANRSPFQIMIPAWVYPRDLSGTTGGTKLTNTNYSIDNIYLSKHNRFFYGGSSTTSHSWYSLGSGTTAPEQASVEAPRKWIDVDLDSQTFELDYTDKVGFESSNYYQPLLTRASISMNPAVSNFGYTDYLSSDLLFVSDSNTLNITSGKTRYSFGVSSLAEKQSYINVSVDRARTGVELVASSVVTGAGKLASVSAHIDISGRSLVSLQSDRIIARSSGTGGSDVARFETPAGAPALHASYIANNTSNSTSGGSNHLAYTVEGTTVTTTSASYAANATQCFAYFTTGPSGYAEVHVSGFVDNDGAASTTYLSFEIAEASNLGSPVVAADDDRAVANLGTAQMSASTFYLFTGLPNTRYKIRTMHRATSGTGTIFTRSVMVIPIT